MRSLSILALRYLAWLIGLRIVFGLLVQVAGLPNSAATGVILASAPLADIGMQAVKRATDALRFKDWALIWGLCLSIFVAVQVILPAIVLAPMRALLADPEGLRQIAVIMGPTALMMALFLWIGQRSARGPGRPGN
jgi:amino acid permease